MNRVSGTFQKQIEGYRAFIPEPLPPRPALSFDNELQTLLSKADRALGRLDGSVQSLPNPDLFVFMYVRKEAVLSSQIEGTQASLGDVLQAEADIFDPTRPDDTEETLNYVSALNYGLERLVDLPLSLRLLREIHARLMVGTRGQHATPGEFRTSQNWIGAPGCTLDTATFVPPPPGRLLDVLGSLEAYINDHTDLPLLIHIGLVHAQFETIHPFLDGNGRLGRLLITFLLCEKAALSRPVLYLSHYLRANRTEYYDRLQATRMQGDWEGWLKFYLRGVSEVANEATETSRRIVNLREDHRNQIIEFAGRGAATGLRLIESMYQRPFVSAGQAADRLGITVQAAHKLIERLVARGLLVEITGRKRDRLYSYDPYIRLFED